MSNPFHACATCIHFTAARQDGVVKYYCSRLNYETKTHYQFNCWTPKEHVVKLMEKRKK
ncbi:hypothetical protein [Bacillus sp. T33-2]|uniref:hypothetical protein n=1 Tax=Bacillus sp. T33-2 TaxID=2054168 RepID=UPI0015E0956C|nr:hypothetical protein [Bacillus sp. T33-2]